MLYLSLLRLVGGMRDLRYHQVQAEAYLAQGHFGLALIELELARKIASRATREDGKLEGNVESISKIISEIKKRFVPLVAENVVLRRAEELDAEQIHRAHMKSINEICSKDHSKEEIRVWGGRKYDPNFRIPAINGQFYVVVECEDQIEGFCQLEVSAREDEKTARLKGLFVTPKILHKKVGAALIGLVFEYCRSLDIQKITLRSSFTAFDFYKKCGFVQTGEIEETLREGVGLRGFPMEWVDTNIL
ncbi:MAG: GNAT family N-acetyltransferase [Bdellovibrionaceae bacterium]|nr:GNAT family N-acetyltransferase [Pseudobdellovibrionaceae bacterium]